MTYGVWCEVWGGATGARSSWLKRNRQIQTFTDREQAQKMADQMTRVIANNPMRKAEFRYTVKEMP